MTRNQHYSFVVSSQQAPFIAGLIDSHCHLDYPPALEDLDGVIDRAIEAGVEQFVHVGCRVSAWPAAEEIINRHHRVFAALGIHPHDAQASDDADFEDLRSRLRHHKVLAVGETGLDYFYEHSEKSRQLDCFAKHVNLAKEVDLPLVLHIRDAHNDAWDLLRTYPPRDNPGIVHCFTGGPTEARRWLDLGWHLSFSGIATFKKATEVQAAAQLCPADRILLETDAPFLAPEPKRGRKNEPANVAFTCAHIASLRREPPSSLAMTSSRNARNLLRLPATA